MKKRQKFPPEAIEVFRRMQALDRYEAEDAWRAEHNRLHDSLGCKPWDWPCIEDPRYAPIGYAPNPDAVQRYRELAKAAAA
jgi:hypothetical protein